MNEEGPSRMPYVRQELSELAKATEELDCAIVRLGGKLLDLMRNTPPLPTTNKQDEKPVDVSACPMAELIMNRVEEIRGAVTELDDIAERLEV